MSNEGGKGGQSQLVLRKFLLMIVSVVIVTGIAEFFGLLFLIAGSHLLSSPYYSASPGGAPSLDLTQFGSGVGYLVLGLFFIGLSLSSFTYALLKARITTSILESSGYVISLTGIVSTIFIASTTTTVLRQGMGIADSLVVGYPLTIACMAVGIVMLYMTHDNWRRKRTGKNNMA